MNSVKIIEDDKVFKTLLFASALAYPQTPENSNGYVCSTDSNIKLTKIDQEYGIYLTKKGSPVIQLTLFKDQDNNYIFAFSGTDFYNNKSQIITDTLILTASMNSILYNKANSMVQDMASKYNIDLSQAYVTGHSLGGTLAQHTMDKNNFLNGMSFNAVKSNENTFVNQKTNFTSNRLIGDPFSETIGMFFNNITYGIDNEMKGNYTDSFFSIWTLKRNWITPHLTKTIEGLTNGCSENSEFLSYHSNKIKHIIKDTSPQTKDPLVVYIDQPEIIPLQYSGQYYNFSGNISYLTTWILSGYTTYFLVKKDDLNNITLFGNDVNNGFDDLISYCSQTTTLDNTNPVWSSLYLWNGLSDENISVISLDDFNIQSISLIQEAQNIEIGTATLTSSSTITMNDGTTQSLGEVQLLVDTSNTINALDTTTDISSLSTLPQTYNIGVLPQMLTAAVNNTELQTLLSNFQNLDPTTLTYETLKTSVENILYEWSKSSPIYNTQANDLTNLINGCLGQEIYFYGHQTYINYGAEDGNILNYTKDQLVINLLGLLALQGPYKTQLSPYFTFDTTNNININFNEDENLFTTLENVIGAFDPTNPQSICIWSVIYSLIYQSVAIGIGDSQMTQDITLEYANTYKPVFSDLFFATSQNQNPTLSLNNGVYTIDLNPYDCPLQTFFWSLEENLNITQIINPTLKNYCAIYPQNKIYIKENIENLTFSINQNQQLVITSTTYQTQLTIDKESCINTFIFQNAEFQNQIQDDNITWIPYLFNTSTFFILNDNTQYSPNNLTTPTLYIAGAQNTQINYDINSPNLVIYDSTSSTKIFLSSDYVDTDLNYTFNNTNLIITLKNNQTITYNSTKDLITIVLSSGDYIYLTKEKQLTIEEFSTITLTPDQIGQEIVPFAQNNTFNVDETNIPNGTITINGSLITQYNKTISLPSNDFTITLQNDNTLIVTYQTLSLEITDVLFLDKNSLYETMLTIKTPQENYVYSASSQFNYTTQENDTIIETGNMGIYTIPQTQELTDIIINGQAQATISSNITNNLYITLSNESKINLKIYQTNGLTTSTQIQKNLVVTQNQNDLIYTFLPTQQTFVLSNALLNNNINTNVTLSFYNATTLITDITLDNSTITWTQDTNNITLSGNPYASNIFNMTLNKGGITQDETYTTTKNNTINVNNVGPYTFNYTNYHPLNTYDINVNNPQFNLVENAYNNTTKPQSTLNFTCNAIADLTLSCDNTGNLTITTSQGGVITVPHNYQYSGNTLQSLIYLIKDKNNVQKTLTNNSATQTTSQNNQVINAEFNVPTNEIICENDAMTYTDNPGYSTIFIKANTTSILNISGKLTLYNETTLCQIVINRTPQTQALININLNTNETITNGVYNTDQSQLTLTTSLNSIFVINNPLQTVNNTTTSKVYVNNKIYPIS